MVLVRLISPVIICSLLTWLTSPSEVSIWLVVAMVQILAILGEPKEFCSNKIDVFVCLSATTVLITIIDVNCSVEEREKIRRKVKKR
jgi:hypothetical protein